MTFGEKLRESRAKKGMTQSELAKAANLGLNTISNYESGKTYPKKREVYDILAEILEVDVNYLRNENEEFITEASENMDIEVSNKPISLYRRLAAYLQAVSCPMMKWMAL